MRSPRLAPWRGAIAAVCALFAIGATCEQQDFTEVDQVFVVSADDNELVSRLDSPMTHTSITRHSVDYEVRNRSDQTIEVVVHAESLINGEHRADGRAVLRAEPGEVSSGRIPDLALQVGNELDLELQCCSRSQCMSDEVLCPADATSTNALVCMQGCGNVRPCHDACAGSAECAIECESSDDPGCIDGCEHRCRVDCDTGAVACAANCLAMFRRCNQLDPPPLAQVPCALCGAGDGLCDAETLLADGCRPAPPDVMMAPWTCPRYPGICSSDCLSEMRNPGATDEARYSCLESCILMHQSECGLDSAGIDPRVQIPCCFSESCEAEMSAVVKLSAVECFEDADCGTSRRCNERLICENRLREEQSSCAVVDPRSDGRSSVPTHGLLALAALLALRRTRRRMAKPRRSRVEMMAAVAGLVVLYPIVAEAEPRGFRRTRSTLAVGLSSGTFVGGAMGSATGAGLGLTAQQTITQGYWGGSFRVGASVFGTQDGGLPFDTGFQAYFLAAGVRMVIPTADEIPLFITLQPEYVFQGLQSNSIVSVVQAEVLHGGGLQTSLNYQALDWLVIDGAIGFTWFYPVNSGALTGGLSVGFSGLL